MNRAERKELAKVAVAEARKSRDEGVSQFRGETGMVEMYRDDCKQLKEVYKLFVQGKLNEAKSKADGLDTAVREAVNDRIWDVIHGKGCCPNCGVARE